MATAATYAERKEQSAETGVCKRPSCNDLAASGSDWCRPHWDAEREYQREYKAGIRAERKRKGQCLDCGVKLRKRRGERVWCARHRLRRDRARPEPRGVQVGVQDRAERIAARTVRGDDGRTRYHGQERRGPPANAQLDEQDLGFARREIARGEAGLQTYRTEAARAKGSDPEAMPRIQREGIKSDALGYLERATRHIGDVLERNGHFRQRHGRRDETE